MRSWWTRLALAVATAAAVAATLPSTPVSANEQQAVAQGKTLYTVYCQNCHGKSGKGDGPTARLMTVKPKDLTRISKRNGGEFPRENVMRIIDGRELMPGHGRRNMPIWGLSMQQLESDANQEDEVRTKIGQLASYLESIQRGR